MTKVFSCTGWLNIWKHDVRSRNAFYQVVDSTLLPPFSSRTELPNGNLHSFNRLLCLSGLVSILLRLSMQTSS